MQNDKSCYICGKLGFDTPGQELHHIIHGVANRKLADEDGLTCWLCKYHHTRLHDKGEWDKDLQREAQQKWMDINGRITEEWVKRYGKSFL